MEKVCIFIDGANFYHIVLKKLGVQEIDFDFEKFANFLANGRQIIKFGKRFYVGTVREDANNPRSIEAMSKQTSLFTRLRSYKWEIKTSKLRRKNERIVIDDRVTDYKNLLKKGIKQIEFTRWREKGIDVKLAVDLIVGAIDNQYDTAIIVSSDQDIIPAIDWVKYRRRKKIEYIGFSIMYKDKYGIEDNTEPSLSMIGHSNIKRILVASDLNPFIGPITPKLL